MGMNSSLLAYDDCIALFDRAIADPKGIRVTFSDEGAARKMISRLHYCRTLVRTSNVDVYPDTDHPMHGKSEYDKIIVRLRQSDGDIYLYLEHVTAPTVIESLSELEP